MDSKIKAALDAAGTAADYSARSTYQRGYDAGVDQAAVIAERDATEPCRLVLHLRRSGVGALPSIWAVGLVWADATNVEFATKQPFALTPEALTGRTSLAPVDPNLLWVMDWQQRAGCSPSTKAKS